MTTEQVLFASQFVLTFMVAIGVPMAFLIGFYHGRRTKYEDVNKVEPTTIPSDVLALIKSKESRKGIYIDL